ncbi:putative ISH8 transposase [Natrinema sp. J7-2]|nr:putative ISH8 transposase [Natrinema sp. J7-2]
MRRITTLFPSEFLEEHAEELGVVERDRKLQIPAFVWAFVFGFRLRRKPNTRWLQTKLQRHR